MRIVWYILVVVLAVIGALSLLRFGERVTVGGGQGSMWIQVLIGLLCIVGAWRSLKNARAK